MLPKEDKENTGMDHIEHDKDEKSLKIFQVLKVTIFVQDTMTITFCFYLKILIEVRSKI